MNAGKKIVLSKPADWDAWISFVRSRATNNGIWNLINPDVGEKPVALPQPIKPQYTMPANDAEFNVVTYSAYKARKEMYKSDLELYEQQRKAFGDIISFIQETIAVHNVVFIQKEEPHPWNHLRALKRRLAPSDEARSLQLEQRYHQLCKGPGTQDMETWLDHWTATYTEAKERSLGEVTGTRPIRDFLRAIRTKEPTFADARMMMSGMKKGEDQKGEDLYEVIEEFRQHVRLQQLDHPGSGGSHSAFAATFRGQPQPGPPKPCVCGDIHWLSDCNYLVPERRPSGWNPDPAKQSKVSEQLRIPHIKAWVDRALQKRKDRENRFSGGVSGATSEVAAPTTEVTPLVALATAIQRVPGSFATHTSTTQTPARGFGSFTVKASSLPITRYHLQGSWILDNGSDSHVCNSSMLSRFTRTHLSTPDNVLTAGTQTIPIECYGTIEITIRTPTGPQPMTLLNVAYVPDFMTNIVSQDRLYTKGLYFDNWKMHLHREGETIGFVERHNGHYLLENNISTPWSLPHQQQPAMVAATHTAEGVDEPSFSSDPDPTNIASPPNQKAPEMATSSLGAPSPKVPQATSSPGAPGSDTPDPATQDSGAPGASHEIILPEGVPKKVPEEVPEGVPVSKTQQASKRKDVCSTAQRKSATFHSAFSVSVLATAPTHSDTNTTSGSKRYHDTHATSKSKQQRRHRNGPPEQHIHHAKRFKHTIKQIDWKSSYRDTLTRITKGVCRSCGI